MKELRKMNIALLIEGNDSKNKGTEYWVKASFVQSWRYSFVMLERFLLFVFLGKKRKIHTNKLNRNRNVQVLQFHCKFLSWEICV
jgi:hypothetical protein